jgi:hypothetical protein
MGFVTKTKNRYRVVVEVLVEADSMESAQEEALRQFNASRDNVSVVEVREEETLGADLSELCDFDDDELQPTFTVVVEFTVEEAKHLYNLMRVIFNNLQKDPDYTPLMPEARTISKMIDALEDSLGEVIHGI